jgi:membrane protein
MSWLGTIWSLTKETVSQWSEDKAARLGAALAYYAAFAIGPLLVVVIAVAGLVFGADAARGEVVGALKALLGDAGAEGIEAMLSEASKPQNGTWAAIVAGASLLLGATGVVVQLKDALNAIWNVKPKPGGGIWGFVRTYVVSLAAVLALGFLLVVSLTMTALVSAIGGSFTSSLGEGLAIAGQHVLSFALITLLFAMMFKWLPDVQIDWGDVALGAVVTAALFTLGKLAIGLYIGGQNLESAFGAAASIAVLLIWVYYSAQIVFLGAEFTQVYARRFGSHGGEDEAEELEAPALFAAERMPQLPAEMVAPAIAFGLALAEVWQRRRRAKPSATRPSFKSS